MSFRTSCPSTSSAFQLERDSLLQAAGLPFNDALTAEHIEQAFQMGASLTKDSALSFLHRHQPMPDDSDLQDELIQQYDRVRKYCRDNPDPEFIPLLLNSFGNGSGFGVYQVVEDALSPYSPGEVVPHLKRSLTSRHGGVRLWSADIAAGFPSLELLPGLTDLLKDQDSDVRSAAVLALSQLDPEIIAPIFLRHLDTEPDSDIIDLINDHLSDLG